MLLQKQSDLGLCCFSWLFWSAAGVETHEHIP